MTSFTYTIKDPMGIHARPAGLLVKEVKKYTCTITLTKDDKTIPAKNLLGIMSLGVKAGMDITIACDGDGEAEAAAELKAFLEENL